MPVTNYMLLQKFAELQKHTRSVPRGKSGKSDVLEEEGTVAIVTAKITKVQGDTVITENGDKARLFNPFPCVYWKCTATPDSNGVATLKNKLDGLFLNDGSNLYCLGVSGASDEFEVRFQVGTNEIRMNNNFVNVKTPHYVVNGMEVKQ